MTIPTIDMQEFLAGLCRYDQGARLSDALNQWEQMSDPVEAALADSVVMKHVAQREFMTAAIKLSNLYPTRALLPLTDAVAVLTSPEFQARLKSVENHAEKVAERVLVRLDELHPDEVADKLLDRDFTYISVTSNANRSAVLALAHARVLQVFWDRLSTRA